MKKIKILILEANPQSDLKLNDEIQKLQNVIRRSSDREEFEMNICLSVRSTQLHELILDYQPNIIHFCGHGKEREGLVFRDKQIDTDALSSLFELFKEHLECVVLNACYSDVQANEIVKHIKYVIGMNQAIRDDAAIAFSIGFYQALGYGKSIEDAFKFGKNAIQLTIGDESKSRDAIIEDTRKFLPMDIIPDITITEEHFTPVLKKKADTRNSQEPLYCNLPHRDYSKFIGREQELQQLLKQISHDFRQHITLVEGIGGVGKTTLLVEAAYHYWEAKQGISNGIKVEFDAIIFTSAKKTYLTPQGELTRPRVQETLQEIFRIIAEVLNEPSIIMAQEANEQLKLIYQSLRKQRTLLIIDNMETILDQEQEAITSFLADLPRTTQAIITYRGRKGMFKTIKIAQLSQEESFQLIKQEATNKAIKITDYQANMLFKHFGGIPVALIYAVGQRAIGYSLKKVLGLSEHHSKKMPVHLANFLFKRSVEPLRGNPAHKLLMSLTFFQTTPSKDALITVAGLNTEPIDVEEGLAQLQQLSLIWEENQRYHILPITRQYALDELTKHSEFLEIARNRWVEWYVRFTKNKGGKDWQDWRIKYDYLAQEWENIASVLHWCAAQDKYAEVKQLWQNIDHYVDLGCYWRTRRHWWKWLIKESYRRGEERQTYIKAISERAWTLTLMGNNEAAGQLAKAWQLREYAEPDVQAHLANHIAVHRMTQKKYDKALEWLKRQEQLINQVELEEKEQIRHQVCIAYYRAEIAYWKWKNTKNPVNPQKAKELFQWALDKGKEIGWQRFSNYAQNWLADLLIIENNLNQAERLLKEGLFVAERNRERRRIGHYQASYARLEAQRNNKEKVEQWANKAINIFDREGIEEDAREMRSLLNSLSSQ